MSPEQKIKCLQYEINEAMDILAYYLGYPKSDIPGSTWPWLDSTGDHTLVTLVEEACEKIKYHNV